MSMTPPQDVLACLRNLESNLPPEFETLMGALPWSVRVASFESSNGRSVLRFFSDGLNLQAKIQMENYLKEHLATLHAGEAQIFMERKEKPAAQAAAPARSPAATSAGGAASAPSAAAAGARTGEPAHKDLGSPSAPFSKKGIPGVRRILAVASGKGGVGKSTVSVNLALALHNQGYKVGVLDADIYGPSLPMMLGLREDPSVNDKNKIVPPTAFGLKVMSFGFFASEESAVIWRGPMVMKALQQFFYDVEWGELDFLVIDLPPGTGDAQLTLVQSLPLAGAVIVTTPQNVALLDAVKGVVMFRKTDVPIVGVVENMSTFLCPSCGTESHVFGEGGATKVSQRFDIPVLGAVPLQSDIRAAGDEGKPLAAVPGHPVRVRFAEIADNVVRRLGEIERK
jgi:ATP-binding protein involved in chromosome partitioning